MKQGVGLAGAIVVALAAGTTSAAAQQPPVETVMREVDFHVDSTLIMHIDYLRGQLIATRPTQPPSFDDPTSFDIAIDTADITLRTTALSALLNRHVFDYHGAPIRGLRIQTDGAQLKQRGRLHGIPFSLRTTLTLMPDGELRLHPESIHALGIGVHGLMNLFGLSLQKLANVKQAPGLRIEHNDLLLTPAAMLPPPRTRGTLVAFAVGDSTLTLHFGGHGPARALPTPGPGTPNYMYFRGGTIHFGLLTMTPANLLVVDAYPRDAFDFWLARYQEQLVAGVSRTTHDNGLITTWPDFNRLARPR